ncbi:acyl-ACP--UDP-N-acetylglucosamine O-acyltransferase [Brackiella oedipodis]|uniref:acyl-ACP--UDP-N-acetylglucosamine O-acyltransferase n=1 Tax=Brackiella oedipodis TaxID=124225 RepID=UPI00048F333F|nr:acyl-ACP--UDP-N-acetylglucosamine O-acyltransferase [Brackiella oedipodis]
MQNIHETAIIHEGAKLHPSVKVGAYSIIYPDVTIDEGTVVGEHCVISGITSIGKNNIFYRCCSIGGQPQDKKYNNEPTELRIGNNNMFREFVTVNTGTVQDLGYTQVGDYNWIMAYTHIAHDCVVGNQTVIANSVQMAGHVHIDDWAIIGGNSSVHQFCHIGKHCMVGGMSGVRQSIPPYVIGSGFPFKPRGVNLEGIRRRGFTPEQMSVVKEGYKLIYLRKLGIDEALTELKQALSQKQDTDQAAILQDYIDFFTINPDHRGLSRS